VLFDALIIAAAGGGSSGFGGGGGGGGGGFSGGGSGSGGGDPVVVLIVIVAALLFFALGLIKGLRVRKRRRERVAAVELASAVAADEDAAFAAERVRAEAERLYRDVQAAWDARDVERQRQQRRIVGEVAVDLAHDAGAARERVVESGDVGRPEAVLRGAVQHLDVRVGRGEPVRDRAGAVGRGVVDDEHPAVRDGGPQRADHPLDVVGLAVGGQDGPGLGGHARARRLEP
jgi:hypothetical protein